MENVSIIRSNQTMNNNEANYLLVVKEIFSQPWGTDVYMYEEIKSICKQKKYHGVLDFLANDVECKYGRCYLAPSSNG